MYGSVMVRGAAVDGMSAVPFTATATNVAGKRGSLRVTGLPERDARDVASRVRNAILEQYGQVPKNVVVGVSCEAAHASLAESADLAVACAVLMAKGLVRQVPEGVYAGRIDARSGFVLAPRGARPMERLARDAGLPFVTGAGCHDARHVCVPVIGALPYARDVREPTGLDRPASDSRHGASGADLVHGHAAAKVACALAAAGGHPLLLELDSPTDEAQRVADVLAGEVNALLPPLEGREREELLDIASLCDVVVDHVAARQRPHVTMSGDVGVEEMLGRTPESGPGPLTQAHGGTLYVPSVAELGLAQVTCVATALCGELSMRYGSCLRTWPTDFTLVATAKPPSDAVRALGERLAAFVPIRVAHVGSPGEAHDGTQVAHDTLLALVTRARVHRASHPDVAWTDEARDICAGICDACGLAEGVAESLCETFAHMAGHMSVEAADASCVCRLCGCGEPWDLLRLAARQLGMRELAPASRHAVAMADDTPAAGQADLRPMAVAPSHRR